ncbi:hypothetical protein ACFXTH_000818 [Malus domestica]
MSSFQRAEMEKEEEAKVNGFLMARCSNVCEIWFIRFVVMCGLVMNTCSHAGFFNPPILFVLRQQRGQAQGVPPRPTAEAVNPSQSGKAMDESFDKEVEDVNRDTKAYEACLKCLEGERRKVLGEADFLNEKLKGHLSNTV